MTFKFSYSDDTITLSIQPDKQTFIGRLFKKKDTVSFSQLSNNDRALAFAISDLRALAEEHQEEVNITNNDLCFSHHLAGCLDSNTAQNLGLPPLVDLTLKTDIEGSLGSPSFRLRHEWLRNGVQQLPQRTGSILSTSQGLRRLPLWMMEAVEVAENFTPGGGEASDWEAMARFRQSLDPGVQMGNELDAVRVSMTDFLQGLEVRLADRFSISTPPNQDGSDFEIIPFSGKSIDMLEEAGEIISESDGELSGPSLHRFQQRVRTQGVLPAYRVGEGSYLVIDRSARPVLEVMANKQKAPQEERLSFIHNPRPAITAAIESTLRSSGKLDGLDDQGEEEAIEAAAGPAFVETAEYSERVTGLLNYRKAIKNVQLGDTAWLPEEIPDALLSILNGMDSDNLQKMCDDLRKAINSGEKEIHLGTEPVEASEQILGALEKRIAELNTAEQDQGSGTAQDDDKTKLHPETIILNTKDNFDSLGWRPELTQRETFIAPQLPEAINTPLRAHQEDSFQLQLASWKAGMPGILNADEQGLGKTLQTISFLRWLKDNNAASTEQGTSRGPVLIVAPTSLLENWNAEVKDHTNDNGLGLLMRLYGSALSQYKVPGAKGVETKDGNQLLNFDQLHESIREGKGHRFWILTTYTTLTNYQHSFAKIPFSAVVFDEIQAIKNPVSLRAYAARAVNANYRIGLTGTPIENATTDLWAVMDQLAPGSLDTLSNFKDRYDEPDKNNMQQLHQQLFHSQNGLPVLAFRRLKEDVAKELPPKMRYLYPRLMPKGQSIAYENARIKLSQGGAGAALKMLQHIRGVSVHPAMDMSGDHQSFIEASARLQACFDILHRIREKGERALVFIEHRKMQFRFMELAKKEFGLEHIDHINGDTPIQKRQKIVQDFQKHLIQDNIFALLVLGPKAAGTGLTLTAATHVIHLSRWWNPAVEEQCNDRVHRIGQKHPVNIYMPMAIHSGYREHSFDCLLHSLMSRKRHLARSALWPMGDCADDTQYLQAALKQDRSESESVNDAVNVSMQAMFERDGETGTPTEDGAYRIN